MTNSAPASIQIRTSDRGCHERLGLDVELVREEFPALQQSVNGRPLVYLDNAATALKPQRVIDAVVRAYAKDSANVHRGVHTLSQRATDAYEAGRETAAKFLGARDPAHIVFVRGTTEALNLVAQSFARPRLGPGDEVLVTGLEHHSNIVPWQLVCGQTGARLVVVPITPRGEVSVAAVKEQLNSRTRIVALGHASNALGTVLPVREMCAAAQAVGAKVVVDGAQAAPHLPVDVTALGCDFYAFSGHKVYGPTGVGVLYGRGELLAAMNPYQGGGDMIESVSFEKTHFKPPPHRFEAGTPNIAGVIGLTAALEYVQELGWEAVRRHETALLRAATDRLLTVPGLEIMGRAADKIAVLSFVLEGVHPHDLATIADLEGVAIRAGHHCAQPVMDRLGVVATARASFAVYNTVADVEALHRAVLRAKEIFG